MEITPEVQDHITSMGPNGMREGADPPASPCHSDLSLQAFLAQRDELVHTLLLQMQKLRPEEEMGLPKVTREEP